MTRVVAFAAAAAILGACIGRPVVGHRDPDDPELASLCVDDQLDCTEFGAPEAYPEVDGSHFVAPRGCSDRVLRMTVTEGGYLDDLDLRCRTLELTVGHGIEVILQRPQIEDARIVLIADGVSTVTLVAATGAGASIAVDGMSELRLLSLSEVGDLRVDATSESLGWDVLVEDSSLDGLAVRTGPDARLSLRESRLHDSTFEAGQLQLRAVTLEDSQLDAKEIDSSGTDITDSLVRGRRGSFIAGNLNAVRWDGCESVLLGETVAEELDIGPCAAAPLELRASHVSRSAVRGHVFALQTGLSTSLLGVQPGASLSLFDARVTASLLCSVDSLAARGGTVMTCARCDPWSPRAACIDPSSAVAVVACPTLVDTAPCDEDLPIEVRQEPGGAPVSP